MAYVQCDSHLSPDLSVRQTLSLHHWLRYSSAHHTKLNTKDRVSFKSACVISIAILYIQRVDIIVVVGGGGESNVMNISQSFLQL